MSTLTFVRRFDTTVHRSPACDMPQYAGYRHTYRILTGAYALSSANSAAQAVAAVKQHADDPFVSILCIPVNYDGDPVVGAAWAGGTWHGTCGSLLWVVDTGYAFAAPRRMLAALSPVNTSRAAFAAQSGCSNTLVETSQQHWLRGFSEPKGADGFWVECQHDQRHDGDCEALGYTWNWRTLALVPSDPTTLF